MPIDVNEPRVVRELAAPPTLSLSLSPSFSSASSLNFFLHFFPFGCSPTFPGASHTPNAAHRPAPGEGEGEFIKLKH